MNIMLTFLFSIKYACWDGGHSEKTGTGKLARSHPPTCGVILKPQLSSLRNNRN